MPCVLHAEDDPNVSAIVRSYFTHYAPDWEMESVPNGTACLERMAKGGIDILLLDLVMPDINGLQVLNELARRGDTTPVVMASGLGQTDLAVRALRAGAVDCVDKTSPQFLQIVDIVKRVLSRHREKKIKPPATPAARDHHDVVLLEVSALARRTIEEYFIAHAPEMTLTMAASLQEFDRLLGPGGRADAVLIGPTPGELSTLDALRKLRSHHADLPAVLIAPRADGEAAIAAFKLGAQDYILQKPDYLAEVVFSLSNILRQSDTQRSNTQLTRELESLNRSLEAQVQTRTSELQALSMRLLKVQEDERRAIARELHDHLGQLLTGLKFQLEASRVVAAPPLQATLTEALGTSDEILRYLREMTQQLRPRVLDDLGLVPAIEWHTSQFQRQTGITVTMDVSLPEKRLPGELETVVFRVVQEALTNIARHSGAKSATVTLTTGEGKLLVEITDRGKGFDLEARLAARDSLGLTGMRERVTLASGHFEIFSWLGQGTQVHAEFPLPP
ncbi:MAG: response regulator receiver sensor signal transduction histidine kinase [Lacunisphaera sp.]|nr:response regulator receiver sensor signal transduction histidine kinase [Lacunisphaera sp.]MDB6166725.1 response regulator receiver sensor signal transduction histidine kinase [Lacunisphaera sp.]